MPLERGRPKQGETHVVTDLGIPAISPLGRADPGNRAYRCSCGQEFIGFDLGEGLPCPNAFDWEPIQ